MRNPARTPFAAVFRTEVLLNSKRVAPYVMTALFGANAWLWTAKGAAVSQGWATNSDFYIARNLLGFSFILGLPLFNALIMGDPVIRDFRAGMDPLIFSKPVGRTAYLLGKFFGNFFVLVCCLATFPLTMMLMQPLHTTQMVVLPARVLPYFRHFFFFLVVSHMALAALFFAVGTLTRNAKIVYGLAVSFYPLYIAYQVVVLKGLPPRWRQALDPLLFNWGAELSNGRSPAWLDEFVVGYTPDMIANRALVLLAAALCLTVLRLRFRVADRPGGAEHFSTLDLSTRAEGIYDDSKGPRPERGDEPERQEPREKVSIPAVNTASAGVRANLRQLAAAAGVEFRLLRAERSLVVIVPLAVFLSTLEVAFYEVVPEPSYSDAYAAGTARSLLLFLSAVAVFYTGEAVHRDRELRVEPLLWSVPAPDSVPLLSKFSTTLLLSMLLGAAVCLTAVALQIGNGHAPVEVSTYLKTYSLILLPSMVFLVAAAAAFNVLLRDKHLAYAVIFAVGGGLFYLFSQGYNHWLYNPVLYGLWSPSDLNAGGGRLAIILTHRAYWLALSALCLALAHLFFGRPSDGGLLRAGVRPSAKGWSLLLALASAAVALIAGLVITRLT